MTYIVTINQTKRQHALRTGLLDNKCAPAIQERICLICHCFYLYNATF